MGGATRLAIQPATTHCPLALTRLATGPHTRFEHTLKRDNRLTIGGAIALQANRLSPIAYRPPPLMGAQR